MGALALIFPSLLWMRVSVAVVWLYEGLWCKVLGMMPTQLAIVVELPGFSRERALVLLKSVGAVEIFLGFDRFECVANPRASRARITSPKCGGRDRKNLLA